MTPDNPFLTALLADPDDDTLRLALADWLDENDQPARAEFVRVQVELARGVPDRDRLRHLELRQRDLLMAHDREWVVPLAWVLGCAPGQWGGWVFRRGFVEYFNLPVGVLNKHGQKLAELTPIRELFLRTNSGSLITLFRKSWLASVTNIYVEGAGLSGAACAAMLESRHLKNLRVLRYAHMFSTPEAVADEFRRRFGPSLQPTGRG